MACFSPLLAWQLEGGEIVFCERGKIRRELKLPCGQCIGCRLERSRQWAIRCVHEASLYDANAFVTLTYDEEHLPHDGSLRYRDFQLFMKRLRKHKDGIRFYMCGEYGEQYGRPHYHACLFNCDFSDRDFLRTVGGGGRLYSSRLLAELWPYGFSSFGAVTFESAAYVARYVVKKVTGEAAKDHYKSVDPETGEIFDRVPEFTRMSLKPGIGYPWFERFRNDVYPRDYVVLRGKKMKAPKAYDRWLAECEDYVSDEVEFGRFEKSLRFAEDCTEERLAVREKVAESRLALQKRKL